MFLFCGSTEKDLAVWPWRIVFLSNFTGSVVSFFLAINENLSDLSFLHLITVIVQVLWWISFTCCLLKNPTFVKESIESRRSYKTLSNNNNNKITTSSSSSSSNSSSNNSNNSNKSTINGINGNQPLDINIQLENSNLLEAVTYSSVLDSMTTSTNDEESFPHLCHSCHVVRPLRSKHCKVLRRCIQRVSYEYYILIVFLLLCICLYSFVVFFLRDSPLLSLFKNDSYCNKYKLLSVHSLSLLHLLSISSLSLL